MYVIVCGSRVYLFGDLVFALHFASVCLGLDKRPVLYKQLQSDSMDTIKYSHQQLLDLIAEHAL